METYFTVKNVHLNDLSPSQAVDFFRRLLHAEARRLSIPATNISVTANINAKDGGVDATVRDSDAQDSLIRLGKTYYQIKTGKSVAEGKDVAWDKNSAKRFAKSLLFGSKKPSEESLGPSIKKCLDAKGTYVIVLFGVDPNDPQQEESFKSELVDLLSWYDGPKVEIFGQNKIISLLEPYPSLQLELNKRDFPGKIWKVWGAPEDMRYKLAHDEAQQTLIESTRERLKSGDKTCHIRVLGDPGVGKTRSILEATNDIELGSSVLYISSPDLYINTSFAASIRNTDSCMTAILVVDECDEDAAAAIWREIQPLNRKFSLVTIYNDEIERREGVEIATPLSEDKIKEIITGYDVPEHEANDWARLCDGSPRVAHVIGWNIKNNPDDPLRPSQYGDLWKRFVATSTDFKSQVYNENLCVLLHCALFRRFGYEKPVDNEARAIQKMAQEHEASMTWGKFQEVVRRLKGRKILQGSKTLYITPKAFNIWLWKEWWETFGSSFDYTDLSQHFDGKLKDWFVDMLIYARESRAAEQIVSGLLDPQGPFRDEAFFKTDPDGSFFLALSKANPKKSLTRLQSSFEGKSKEELLNFKSGRQYVVWALEVIAFKKELFCDAAELLLRLAESENASNSNNATGTFKGLFSPGVGPVAMSAAPPLERFPVLKRNITGASQEVSAIVVDACEVALKSQHFTKMGGPPKAGLRKIDEPWMPKTWGEIFSYYRNVWDLLKNSLEELSEETQIRAAEILLNQTMPLLHYKALHDDFSARLRDFVATRPRFRKELVRKLRFELKYRSKKDDDELIGKIEQLLTEIQGNGVDDVIQRVVGIDMHEYQEDDKATTDREMSQIAKQLKCDLTIFDRNLSWLVSREAENGFSFGMILQQHLSDPWDAWQRIIEAIKGTDESCVFFASGFLNAIRESDEELWKKCLRLVIDDSDLVKFLPELVWRTKFNEYTCSLLLDLLKKRVIDANQLGLFGMGGVVSNIPEGLFADWCREIIKHSYGAEIALQQFFFYYIHRDKSPTFPLDIATEILTSPQFFNEDIEPRAGNRATSVDHYWADMARKVAEKDDQAAQTLADLILRNLDNNESIVSGYDSKAQNVLGYIVKKDPFGMWQNVKLLIDPENEEKSWSVREFAKKYLIPEMTGQDPKRAVNDLFGWVGADDARRYILSSMTPKFLGKDSIAREYLKRHGETREGRSSIHVIFGSDGWVGPASEHFRNVKKGLEEQLANETESNVRKFLTERIEYCEREIESSKVREEREF